MIQVEAVCISSEFRVHKLPQTEAYAGEFGFAGDRHARKIRWSASARRPIPNRRPWSAVSSDEVEEFCARLGVAPFPYGALGENLRLSGVRLSEVPKGAILEFPSGARLQVSSQNDPCQTAAEELGLAFGPYVERYFVKEAFGKRGVVGIVLEQGLIRPGDAVDLVLPLQKTQSRLTAREPDPRQLRLASVE
jgi:MOSC domain-containing protein YiiM